MVYLRAIIVAMLALGCAAPALAALDPTVWCAPKTAATPNAPGSPMLFDLRLVGGWEAHWCPVAAPPGAPPGVSYFRPYVFGGLYAYGWSQVAAASERVNTAADPEGQARIEVAALTVPASNPVDDCRKAMFQRDACISLHSTVMPGYPTPVSSEQLAAICGPAVNCDALPPPPVVWKSTGTGTIYPLVNGKPGSTPVPGKKATPGSLCDCSAPVSVGSVTYCPLAGGSAAEVTSCKKVTQ